LVGNHSTLGDLAVQVIDHIDPSKTPQILFHHYSLPNFDAGKRPQLESGLSIKSGKLRVADGTLLLSKLNPASPKVWRIAKAMGQHAIASTEFLVLQPRAGVTLNALYAACLNPSFLQSIAAKATGTSSSHQRVRPSDLLATNLHLGVNNAGLAEIGDFISAIDDKIELNRRMNTTLEAMARALFQSWFVDFDPVHAKAEGRQPVGMDAETAALFPDSFEDSALGPIPKGWAHTYLSAVADVGSGKRPSAQYECRSPSASVPIFGGAGQTGWTDTPLINEPVILTGRVGTLGRVLRTEGPIWPSDNTLVIQPKALWINQLYFALQNVDLLSLNRGSSQPMITQHDIRSQLIVVADSPVSLQFEALVSPLFELQTMLNANIEQLADARQALLPRLLSGELRVGDVAA
jgi:type I restriction enzyme S subunit